MRNLAYSSTSQVLIYNKTSLTLISSQGESSLQNHFPATTTLASPSADRIGNKLLWLLPLIFLFLVISRLIKGCFSAGVPGKIVVDDEGANSLRQGKKNQCGNEIFTYSRWMCMDCCWKFSLIQIYRQYFEKALFLDRSFEMKGGTDFQIPLSALR